MSSNEDEGEEHASLIGQQHDVPPSEVQPINISVLSDEERDINDEEFFLRPQEKLPEGFMHVIQLEDSLDQVVCYLFRQEKNAYGWCRCRTFGHKKMCEHLFIAFKWENGLLRAKNQDIALEAREILSENSQ
jgi:hypothetical protein